MIGVGFGAILNLRYGIRPRNYAISMISALFGATVSLRQILLHVEPGDVGYGSAILGFHLYTWAFIVFAVSIFFIGVMFLFDKQFQNFELKHVIKINGFIKLAIFILLFVTAANIITTFLECGFQQCPDNPDEYLELLKLKKYSY